MAPEILTVMTSDLRERAPEPLIYHDVMRDTRIDPWEPWYPCGCPHRLDGIHVDDCWLDWLHYPLWMQEDTTEVPALAGAGGGWIAPPETMNWCGHPLRENCGCEFTPVPASEVVLDLSQDDTVLLGVVEPPSDVDDEGVSLEELADEMHEQGYDLRDEDDEEVTDGDVRGAAAENTVDGGDGRG